MNKYLGFYELKHINIPTIPWKEFTKDTVLDPSLLWTLRVAVENSHDLNLPRFVGVPAAAAMQHGLELLSKYASHGLVIYYPYFIAQKSGVIEISNTRTVIEAVEKDLWNLVTHGFKNVTLLQDAQGQHVIGDDAFLDEAEVNMLFQSVRIIKGKYRDLLFEGKSVFAEWSFAYHTDILKQPIGDPFLVFYELRSVG